MAETSGDDPLTHMRERIELCRRMAKNTTDRELARQLRAMADQGEIDLQRLLNERKQSKESS